MSPSVASPMVIDAMIPFRLIAPRMVMIFQRPPGVVSPMRRPPELRIEPRHRGSDPALVQENQLLRPDRRDSSEELLTLFTIGFGIALAGLERLFLSRSPSFLSSFQTWGKLSETLASPSNFCCTSASVRSAC